MVSQVGMNPSTAACGSAGLRVLRDAAETKKPFGLVLIDEQMPEMGGFAVIDKIREMPEQRQPAIVMLTSADQSSSSRCRELGVTNYLIKPIKLAELVRAMREALVSFGPETLTEEAKPIIAPIVAPVPLRILLAEDNLVNQKLASRLMSRMGHEVIVAENGMIAIRAWEEFTPDLIFMDVQMPEMDGFAATTIIRQREAETGSSIPIIAMTAHAMAGDRERCLDHGMDDYISKPIDAKKLEGVIATWASRANSHGNTVHN
jgi:two-component system sensor histidine kinase/response regulator